MFDVVRTGAGIEPAGGFEFGRSPARAVEIVQEGRPIADVDDALRQNEPRNGEIRATALGAGAGFIVTQKRSFDKDYRQNNCSSRLDLDRLSGPAAQLGRTAETQG